MLETDIQHRINTIRYVKHYTYILAMSQSSRVVKVVWKIQKPRNQALANALLAAHWRTATSGSNEPVTSLLIRYVDPNITRMNDTELEYWQYNALSCYLRSIMLFGL